MFLKKSSTSMHGVEAHHNLRPGCLPAHTSCPWSPCSNPLAVKDIRTSLDETLCCVFSPFWLCVSCPFSLKHLCHNSLPAYTTFPSGQCFCCKTFPNSLLPLDLVWVRWSPSMLLNNTRAYLTVLRMSLLTVCLPYRLWDFENKDSGLSVLTFEIPSTRQTSKNSFVQHIAM